MAKLSDIITELRYDIRDSVATYEHSDAELVNYANRAYRLLAKTLIRLHSDWIHATDTSTQLGTGDTSVAVPTGCIKVRSIWRNTNIEIEDRSLDDIMYDQKFNTAGPPDYYAMAGATIEFNREADDDYDLIIHYDKGATTLAANTDMPYADAFDDVIREAIVIFVKRRDENSLTVDASIAAMFEQAAMEEAIIRTTLKRRTRLDF